MEKFYRLTTYSPYCGEEEEHYFATELDEDSIAFAEIIDSFWGPDMYEWWLDDDSREDYDYDEEAFRGSCGWNLEEISEEEYLKWSVM